MDHWRRGHKQICKKIHRGGNAEQYHADKKYKEAVAVAVKACADDTTIDDLHKSVKALEDLARTARRVLGGAHPFVLGIEGDLLPGARAALARRNLGARTASRTR